MKRAPRHDDIASTVALLAVMAHPARLSMLLALSREGTLSAGELTTRASLEQSAASHQLRVLRDARLVCATREGRRVIYRLADRHVAHIVEDALSHAREGAFA